jgi:anti-anti-sigma factor
VQLFGNPKQQCKELLIIQKVNTIKSKTFLKSSEYTTMNSIVKVVQPSGILDGASTNQLRREISDFVENGATIVLVDFQDVTFINSSALGALVSTLKLVRSAGAELFICSLTEQVKLIFNLTKMNRVFKSFASRDEFEQKVRGEVRSQDSAV